MISTFREIEKWRDGLLVLQRDSLEGFPLLLTVANAQIQSYNYVLDRMVMNHPCSVCDGEKWLMQDVESFNSSRRVHSPCRGCEGTGVCDDA